MNKNLHKDITAVLSADTAHQTRLVGKLLSFSETSPENTVELLTALANEPLPKIILGLTGAPGSGKSVLTNRLISCFRKIHSASKIGVIAVDPSSPFSGGALLGDRIRMMEHTNDEMVFVRSVATRGQFGGITFGVAGMIRVLGMIGCDVVLVETVGVGQTETSIRDIADIVAVVLAPGQGDSVQFLKAGLMEVADVFIVNKSDRPDASEYRAHLESALALSAEGKQKKIFSVSARDNVGVPEFVSFAEELSTKDQSFWNTKRQEKINAMVLRIVSEQAKKEVEKRLEGIPNAASEILSGRITLAEVMKMIFS